MTIINSLLTPILMYPACTTAVPERVFTEYKKIVNCFIWGSEVNRVSYQTLCLPIEEGGLKLLDFNCLVKAAHLKWITRLCSQDQERWTMFPRFIYSAKTSLFHKFLEKVKNSFKTIQVNFYKQVLETWLKLHYKLPKTEKEQQNEILWNNDFITCQRKPIYWDKWAKSGILQFRDLMLNGSMMSSKDVTEIYNVQCNFLELLQIRSAIPWKSKLSMQNDVTEPMCLYVDDIEGCPVNLLNLHSKIMYNIVRKQFYKIPTARSTWQKTYKDLSPMSELWNKLYTTAFRCTRETKLQSLQFKIYHRIVPCRLYLYKRKGIDSPGCLYCGKEDDIRHFFLLCPDVNDFWKSVKRWLKQVLAISIDDEIEEGLILNNPNVDRLAQMENFILLCIKFYIYRQRLFHQNNLNVLDWAIEFKGKLLVEKQICLMENKPKRFRAWEEILNKLS